MECRPACGACCIAPSISSPMPGLPQGKPAGMPCPHLDSNFACGLWNSPQRPKVCAEFRPERIICGGHRDNALQTLTLLEQAT